MRHRLDAAGVGWRDYFTALPTVELYPELFLKNQGTKVVPITEFYADAAAGTLPGFSLVEPNYAALVEAKWNLPSMTYRDANPPPAGQGR